MKICFIHNGYGAEVLSGAQRIVKNLADYLVERGHELTIITCSNSKTIQNRQDSLVRVISLPSNYGRFKTWPVWRRLASHLGGFFNVRAYLRMKRLMKQENFDIVWTHNLIGFGLIVFKALKAQKKIHTVHDIQLLHPSGLLMYQLEGILNTPWAKCYQVLVRLVFPKDALVVFPSHWLAQLSKQYGLALANKQVVLANPLREFKSTTELSSINNFTFLYLGQVESHKGVLELVKAFEKINNPACRLIIAGSGSLLNILNNGSDKRISFLGNVKNPEEVIKQASCVVVPSLCYENLPTAALEAMQAKVPVIGSKLGGLKELLLDEKLMFEPSEQGIAQALTWCLNNPQELKKVAELARQQIKIPKLNNYLAEIGTLVKIIF